MLACNSCGLHETEVSVCPVMLAMVYAAAVLSTCVLALWQCSACLAARLSFCLSVCWSLNLVVWLYSIVPIVSRCTNKQPD